MSRWSRHKRRRCIASITNIGVSVKKKKGGYTLREGQQVSFDESRIFIIKAVKKRGLGKGGYTSYTLNTVEGEHVWCPSRWEVEGKIKHVNVVKKDEDGKYTFSDSDFEVGDEVRLNKFYPMKVMEVQENHVIVSRNNWSSSRFAKEYIIPVDRDTRKIHALFFSIKNFIVKKYHENVPPTPGYGIVEYIKIQRDEYDEFLRDNCDDERLVELYHDLACGCSCCWGMD